jgi:hypothetical protein
MNNSLYKRARDMHLEPRTFQKLKHVVYLAWTNQNPVMACKDYVRGKSLIS